MYQTTSREEFHQDRPAGSGIFLKWSLPSDLDPVEGSNPKPKAALRATRSKPTRIADRCTSLAMDSIAAAARWRDPVGLLVNLVAVVASLFVESG